MVNFSFAVTCQSEWQRPSFFKAFSLISDKHNVLSRMSIYLAVPVILCKRLKNKVPIAYQASVTPPRFPVEFQDPKLKEYIKVLGSSHTR